MAMPAKGLHKLVEECGELVAVIGKKLSYFYTNTHPDNTGRLDRRMEDEIADVIASCWFVMNKFQLSNSYIQQRVLLKLKLYETWDKHPSNAPHAHEP